MESPATKRRWRNILTLFFLGPIVSLLFYAADWAMLGMHPLDRWFYLTCHLGVGFVAGAIAATVYLFYWIWFQGHL